MTIASWFFSNKRLYPVILYNEDDINHWADTITNRGSWGSITMTNFARNNGTVIGGVTISDGAMVFDGNGFLIFPDLWITWSANRTFCALVDLNSISWTRYIFQIWNESSNYKRWSIRNDGSNLRLEIWWWWYTASTLELTTESQYQFIAVVLDGTTVWDHILYIDDDSESATGTETVGTQSWTGRLWFWNTSWWAKFSGAMKRARVYNKALSSDEIASERNSWIYSTIQDGSLVWQMTGSDYAGTEASPTTIYDTNMVVEWHEAGSYAIEFDGSNDYLVLANSTDYSGIDWSIFSRVYINSIPWSWTNHTVLSIADWTGTGGRLLFIGNAAWTVTWRSAIWWTVTRFETLTAPVVDTWYNVCLIKEWTSLTLFVNTESENTTKTMVSANGNMLIWTNVDGTNDFMDWIIQDPRIFKKALTPTEIQRLFNS